MPQPARIDNALPKPLAAPADWDPATNGHCAGLFIRVDQSDGLTYMRSAWDVQHDETLHLLAGAKMVLGISGIQHPVVNMAVDQLPEDFQPAYTVRQIVTLGGIAAARVEGLYPAKGRPQRIFVEEPIDAAGLSITVGRAIDKIEELARKNGWVE